MDSKHKRNSAGIGLPVSLARKTITGTAHDGPGQFQSEGARKDGTRRQTCHDTSQFKSSGEASDRRTGAATLWTKRPALQLSKSNRNSDAGTECAETVDESPGRR